MCTKTKPELLRPLQPWQAQIVRFICGDSDFWAGDSAFRLTKWHFSADDNGFHATVSYEGEPSYPSYEEYSGNNRAAHRESSRVSVAPATVFAKELKRLAPAPDRNLPKIGGPVDLPPAPQPTLDLITPEPIFPELAYSPTPAPFSPTPAPYSPTPAPYSPTPAPYSPTPAP